jgi:hypothetical protein
LRAGGADMDKKRKSDVAEFDEKIERDAKFGKLDRLAAEALADHHAGRTREL